MAIASEYEDAWRAFLAEHPFNSIVSRDQVVTWAAGYKNGLSDDNEIEDPRKRGLALVRHIGQGGTSPDLPEEERGRLVLDDARRGIYVCRPLYEVARLRMNETLLKATDRLSPIERRQKDLDGIKTAELPDEVRKNIERAKKNLDEIHKIVGEADANLLVTRMIQELEGRGVDPREARLLVDVAFETLPLPRRLSRLIGYRKK